MSTKQKSPILKRIISLIFLLLWMGLIFFLSNQTADESSAVSGGLIKTVIKFILPEISPETLKDIVSALQFFVRKGAHFTLYTVLGIFSFLTFITYERLSLTFRTVLSVFIGVVYAVSDEFHQTFISGRSGEARDVFIDSCGVLLGALISLAIYKIHRHIKNRRVSRMRKKQYIELSDTLQRELHKAKLGADELKEENLSLKKENEALKSELHELRSKIIALETPIAPVEESKPEIAEEPFTEEAPVPEVEIDSDMAYGSQIIGKIVLSAAKHCNSLTAFPSSENVKELVNLILGRTEVAKSEILKIVALDIDRQSKIVALEKELNEAEDYFQSVMAQK